MRWRFACTERSGVRPVVLLGTAWRCAGTGSAAVVSVAKREKEIANFRFKVG